MDYVGLYIWQEETLEVILGLSLLQLTTQNPVLSIFY